MSQEGHPAVGAILFSIYLGYNAVVINVPKIESQNVPVAMLVDWKAGVINSMVRRQHEDRIEKMDRFAGLHQINDLVGYDAFKELNIRERLKAENTNKLDPVYEIELDLVEYALFEWLNRIEQLYIFQPDPKIYDISGSSGGGQILEDPAKIPKVEIEYLDKNKNLFQTKRTVTLSLPKNSRAERTSSKGIRNLIITTPNVTVKFRISLRGGGVFQSDIDLVSKRITQLLGITSTDSLWVTTFLVEIDASQNGFGRFSDQSKLERKWIESLKQFYNQDFSWTQLRDAYAQ